MPVPSSHDPENYADNDQPIFNVYDTETMEKTPFKLVFAIDKNPEGSEFIVVFDSDLGAAPPAMSRWVLANKKVGVFQKDDAMSTENRIVYTKADITAEAVDFTYTKL